MNENNNDTEAFRLDDVVKAYVAIRSERDELRRKYEEEDAAYKEQMETIKSKLLSVCNNMNVSSLKTDSGTVIRKMSERFYSTDWENFSKFVIDNNAIDLLERRIHQANFRSFLSEREKDGLPPGVNVLREYEISVRKST